jgi:hypothetical protein
MKKIYFVGQHHTEELVQLIKCIYKKKDLRFTSVIDGNNVMVRVFDGDEEDDPMEHYVITNIDDVMNLDNRLLLNGQVITMGLNKNAIITASSIQGDDKEECLRITYCLQKEIVSNHCAIEPGEFPVKIKTKLSENIYHILSVTTLLLLTDNNAKKASLH